MIRVVAAVGLSVVIAGCSMPSLPFVGGPPPEVAPASGSGLRTAGGVQPVASCLAQSEATRRARQLVVMIKTQFSNSGAAQFGAGIVVSVRNNVAYILTAKHVVHQDRGGAPVVTVAFGDDESRPVPAKLFPLRGSKADDVMSDIAVVEADLRSQPSFAGVNWAAVRGNAEIFDVKDVSIIGNPGARGKSVTPPGAAQLASGHELRINSGVMEQGYSGGAAFDGQWRLVGLVYEDRGSYAAAYPIEPVIRLIAGQGVPVDLKTAAPARKGIHLARVFGEPAGLSASVDSAARQTLRREGFDPDCDAAGSYKLSMVVKGWRESGSTSVAEIQSFYSGPNGAQLLTDRLQLHFTHNPFQSVWTSPEVIEAKARPAVEELIKKLGVSN